MRRRCRALVLMLGVVWCLLCCVTLGSVLLCSGIYDVLSERGCSLVSAALLSRGL